MRQQTWETSNLNPFIRSIARELLRGVGVVVVNQHAVVPCVDAGVDGLAICGQAAEGGGSGGLLM